MRVDDPRDLGYRARDRRKELGWSQAHLAEQIGSTRFWVSDLESGKPTIELGLVLKALRALELTVDIRAPYRPGDVPQRDRQTHPESTSMRSSVLPGEPHDSRAGRSSRRSGGRSAVS